MTSFLGNFNIFGNKNYRTKVVDYLSPTRDGKKEISAEMNAQNDRDLKSTLEKLKNDSKNFLEKSCNNDKLLSKDDKKIYEIGTDEAIEVGLYEVSNNEKNFRVLTFLYCTMLNKMGTNSKDYVVPTISNQIADEIDNYYSKLSIKNNNTDQSAILASIEFLNNLRMEIPSFVYLYGGFENNQFRGIISYYENKENNLTKEYLTRELMVQLFLILSLVRERYQMSIENLSMENIYISTTSSDLTFHFKNGDVKMTNQPSLYIIPNETTSFYSNTGQGFVGRNKPATFAPSASATVLRFLQKYFNFDDGIYQYIINLFVKNPLRMENIIINQEEDINPIEFAKRANLSVFQTKINEPCNTTECPPIEKLLSKQEIKSFNIKFNDTLLPTNKRSVRLLTNQITKPKLSTLEKFSFENRDVNDFYNNRNKLSNHFLGNNLPPEIWPKTNAEKNFSIYNFGYYDFFYITNPSIYNFDLFQMTTFAALSLCDPKIYPGFVDYGGDKIYNPGIIGRTIGWKNYELSFNKVKSKIIQNISLNMGFSTEIINNEQKLAFNTNYMKKICPNLRYCFINSSELSMWEKIDDGYIKFNDFLNQKVVYENVGIYRENRIFDVNLTLEILYQIILALICLREKYGFGLYSTYENPGIYVKELEHEIPIIYTINEQKYEIKTKYFVLIDHSIGFTAIVNENETKNRKSSIRSDEYSPFATSVLRTIVVLINNITDVYNRKEIIKKLFKVDNYNFILPTNPLNDINPIDVELIPNTDNVSPPNIGNIIKKNMNYLNTQGNITYYLKQRVTPYSYGVYGILNEIFKINYNIRYLLMQTEPVWKNNKICINDSGFQNCDSNDLEKNVRDKISNWLGKLKWYQNKLSFINFNQDYSNFNYSGIYNPEESYEKITDIRRAREGFNQNLRREEEERIRRVEAERRLRLQEEKEIEAKRLEKQQLQEIERRRAREAEEAEKEMERRRLFEAEEAERCRIKENEARINEIAAREKQRQNVMQQNLARGTSSEYVPPPAAVFPTITKSTPPKSTTERYVRTKKPNAY